ncbi:hypothetical protein Hanom_Chr08g00682071 [Helianthus anomalus]
MKVAQPAVVHRVVVCSLDVSSSNEHVESLESFYTIKKSSTMWHLSKIRNNLDFSLHSSGVTCQISGQNFFQVGDDVTTRTFKVSYVLIL